MHRSNRRKALWGLPPLLVAVGLLMLMAGGRQAPARSTEGAVVTPVRVLTVPRLDVVPRVTAFGTVQPDRVWQGVAEVSGRIADVHPNLRSGALIREGTVVLTIDPSDYHLALARAEAQLSDLQAREENLEASLAIQRESLAVARRDLERQETLARRGAVSQSTVDDAQKALLDARLSLQSLENDLRLIPAQRAETEADLAQARLDLDRTALVAPFDLRVAEADITAGRYAQRGEQLTVGDSIAVAEIAAQVPFPRMMALVEGVTRPKDGARAAMTRDPSQILGVAATVVIRAGDRRMAWSGRVVRISDTIDTATRTVGVIVAVDDPYRQAIPGVRPPLIKNLFVEVDLRGPVRPDRVVIPRHAIRDGKVRLARDGRLVEQAVTVATVQDGLAVIAGGLEGGETLVLGDVQPAVAGMVLDPQEDADALAALRAEAGLAAAADGREAGEAEQ